jgi:hypothetical protein
MGKSSSSALDLNDPHWTKTRQQQLLHEMRIPPQPNTTPEETTLVDEIKNQLQRIDDIYDNMCRDREMQRQCILSIAMTGTPIKMTSSLERNSDMGWSLPPNRTPHELEEVNTPTPTNRLTTPVPPKPTVPHAIPPSVSRRLAWNLLNSNQFGAAPALQQIQRPTGGPPPPPPPRVPLPNPNVPQIPAGGFDDEPLQGKEPFLFKGD